MAQKAIIIGNSDGIGLALTKQLLKRGWNVTGLSRSGSAIRDPSYEHDVIEVQKAEYPAILRKKLENDSTPDLCVYCVGIGELLDHLNMTKEVEIFQVNLLGLVETASHVIPQMVKRGAGHFIGLSSLADELLSIEAPSYHASKAGFSNYLEGLALSLKSKGVNVTNVRFGFVDTKMAKGEIRPFMIGTDRAIFHLLKCIEKRPIRYTAPAIVIPLIKIRKWMLRLSTLF